MPDGGQQFTYAIDAATEAEAVDQAWARVRSQSTTAVVDVTPTPPPANCDATVPPGGSLGAAIGAASASDTICLRNGVYNVGTPLSINKRINIQSVPGEFAEMRGRIVFEAGGSGSSLRFVKLLGTDAEYNAMRVRGNDVLIADSEITDTHRRICILVNGARTQFIRNRIHGCGTLPANNHEHGIYNQGNGTVIAGNWIYDNADRGVQNYPNPQGADIYGNVIWDNGRAVNVNGDNIRIHNNILGASIQDNAATGPQDSSPTGNALYDNALHPSVNDIGSTRGFSMSGNVGFANASTVFVDPAGRDFRLLPGVPPGILGVYTPVSLDPRVLAAR
jgi:Right handed beta helix region